MTDIKALISEAEGWIDAATIAHHAGSAHDTIRRLRDALEAQEARIRELEAENRQLLIVGRPDRKANRRYGAVLRERDALAAQIEAARDLWLAAHRPGKAEELLAILSADSEVRARILAEHDDRVRADERARIAGDEWHPRAEKREASALAAQIEAADKALDKSLCGSMPDHDVVYGILSADSEVRARILADVKAEAWDEGDAARQAFYRAAYDVEVPEGEALALLPKNPHRADRIEQEAE
ncbi:hypothetical protein [Agromyces larvae]|uniref:DUF222 domain-containing protein n=1 Tax=Agromyces larvae TaxID=2929802 RepID=A0ABY4C748_9MICO|nr:hypothetical protein [Agromyces larvae]UOE45926.1 hypothetical protein MTO99_09355 [Agromyces larvae]